ncbi:MAG: DUF2231 domain-containing protein [Arenimonas sp.]
MSERLDRTAAHPIHAVFLAGTMPLFLGALLGDHAYRLSEQVQWANFAQWLLAGGLVFATIPLLAALIALFRRGRGARALVYFFVLLSMWVLGFVDSLVHARDAWAVMPNGPVLSAIVFVLCLAAIWIGFARPRAGGAP